MNTVAPEIVEAIIAAIAKAQSKEDESRRASNVPVNAPQAPFFVDLTPVEWAITSYALGLYGGACRTAYGLEAGDEPPAPVEDAVPADVLKLALQVAELLNSVPRQEHRERIAAAACCLTIRDCAGNVIT